MANIFYLPKDVSLDAAKTMWRGQDELVSKGYSTSYIDDPYKVVRFIEQSFHMLLGSIPPETTVILWDVGLIRTPIGRLASVFAKLQHKNITVRILNPNYTLDPDTRDCQQVLSLMEAMQNKQGDPTLTTPSTTPQGFGFKPIDQETIKDMGLAKERGKTLRDISILFDVCIATVCKYTKDVKAKRKEAPPHTKRDQKVFDIAKVDKLPIKGSNTLRVVREFIGSQRTYSTKVNYFLDLEAFFKWAKKEHQAIAALADVTFDMGCGYHEHLKAKGYKASVVKRYFSTLNNLLNYCQKLGYIPNNPVAVIKIQKVSRHQIKSETLEMDELKTLLECAIGEVKKKNRSTERTMIAHRNFVAIYLMTSVGMRVGALLSLRLMDIKKKQGVTYLTMEAKGDDTYTVSIDARAATILERYIEIYYNAERQEAFLFFYHPLDLMRPMTTAAINMAVKKVCKKSGISRIKRVVPHSFRTTYASMQYQAGKTLKEIQTRLNHKSIDQTAAYLQFADKETDTSWVPNFNEELLEFTKGI